MEWGVLVLWNFLHFTIEFGCGSLINAAFLRHSELANSLKDTQNAHCINVSSELWRVETNLNMALGSEVVNLSWAYLADHTEDTH